MNKQHTCSSIIPRERQNGILTKGVNNLPGDGTACPTPLISRAFSVVQRNLQCQPVRGSGHPTGMPLVTRMAQRFKRSKGVNLIGFLKCKSLPKNAHRTPTFSSKPMVARGTWLLEREEHRTPTFSSKPLVDILRFCGSKPAADRGSASPSVNPGPTVLRDVISVVAEFMVRIRVGSVSTVLRHD
jgi:hypothetical protein